MNALTNLPASLRSGWILHAIVFVVAFDTIFMWQKLAGAHASESSGQPGEATQVVTALAIYDRLATGLTKASWESGEQYATDFPNRGVSTLERGFAYVQAAWMLLAGPTREALLLLNCALLAAFLTWAFATARRSTDIPEAGLSIAVFLAFPKTHEGVCSLDSQYLTALLFLMAVIEVYRWLLRRRNGNPLSAPANEKTRTAKTSRRPFFIFGLIALVLVCMLPRKNCVWSGFRPIAQAIVEDSSSPKARILVSSDPLGEGIFTAELALADQRPARRVTLGQALASETRQDAESLTKLLRNGRFDFIVFDDSVTYQMHGGVHDLLKRVLEDSGGLAWEVASAPMIRAGVLQEAPVRLFRVKSGALQP